MPELPEVETVRRELAPWLTGRVIRQARRVDAPPSPKYAGLESARGATIQGVMRRGKFLIAPLSTQQELIIHLGMTGIISPKPFDKHVRVMLELSAGANPTLYFQDVRRFGRFLVVPAGDHRALPTLLTIGPEPLSDAFNPKQLSEALAHSAMPIKPYLLSQKPVAGVGNIYADEALWASKIHPLTPSKRVSKRQIPLLVVMIKDILEASILAQGTTLNDYRTVNGEVGAYLSELKAYGHAGDPCPRCGATIQKITVGGRGTYFCPHCQRRPKGT
jgi:formamidopyrimidine-DNA glycosylase